jgi:peptidoglycan/LPS O-acetylase OafA/YrhL
MVVGGHALNTFLPSITGATSTPSVPRDLYWIVYSPLNLFFNAHFAVLFFFIHSGLVLSFRFFSGGRKANDLTSAAIRRYFRLALPASASVFLGYILLKAGLFSNQPVSELTQSAWLRAHFNFEPKFTSALKQAFFSYYFRSDVPVNSSFNSSLWTIQVELLGSFLVFAVLALIGRLQKRWIFYSALLTIFFNSNLFLFILGILICDTYVLFHLQIPRFKHFALPLLVLGLILGCCLPGSEFASTYRWALPNGLSEQTQGMGAFCIVCAALLSNGFSGLFDKPFFRFLGHISYSVYLLHLSVLCSLGCYLYLLLIKEGFTESHSIWSATVATYTVVLTLSIFYRKFIDKPAIAASKAIQHRYFSAIASL